MEFTEAFHRGSVYIHVPFCSDKCDYCDFYSFVPSSDDFLDRYLQSLLAEIEIRARRNPEKRPGSIFLGGGTPSFLPVDFVARILEAVDLFYGIPLDCEISMEVNPEQALPGYLKGLYRAGVNRVSTGIQSFSSGILKTLGRKNDPDRYRRVLGDLMESPISRIGIDLIYGIPGQNREDVFLDVEKVLVAGVEHISLYGLTAEDGTPYARNLQGGKAGAPDEELQAELFLELPLFLKGYGFEQYEVSNYAKPGGECRHNLHGWLYGSCTGFGPGAHGFDGKFRWENPLFRVWVEDPAGAPRIEHVPALELPAGILRLTGWIPPGLFGEVPGPGAQKVVTDLFKNWNGKGAGELREEDLSFRWNPEGLLYLDNYIFEMAEALSEIKKPAIRTGSR